MNEPTFFTVMRMDRVREVFDIVFVSSVESEAKAYYDLHKPNDDDITGTLSGQPIQLSLSQLTEHMLRERLGILHDVLNELVSQSRN